MNRLNTIFIAVGAAAAAAAFAPPGQAQSGHALAVAEQACLGKHIKPYTNAFNICVNDTARAYDYGELLTARDTCLSCGLNPQTYRVHPDPTDPQYHEEYVVPSRVSYRY